MEKIIFGKKLLAELEREKSGRSFDLFGEKRPSPGLPLARGAVILQCQRSKDRKKHILIMSKIIETCLLAKTNVQKRLSNSRALGAWVRSAYVHIRDFRKYVYYHAISGSMQNHHSCCTKLNSVTTLLNAKKGRESPPPPKRILQIELADRSR